MITAMVWVLPIDSRRPLGFGTKSNSATAANTFCRVDSLTGRLLFKTLDTVPIPTPANFATSWIVAGKVTPLFHLDRIPLKASCLRNNFRKRFRDHLLIYYIRSSLSSTFQEFSADLIVSAWSNFL
jgi:hypothetical protein